MAKAEQAVTEVEAVIDLAVNSPFHEVVEKWVSDHLRNSPLAQYTPAWNCLVDALPKLKTALESLK